MQYVRVATFATAVLWMVSGASAQYGLSGSPEMLALPAAGGWASGQPSYQTTAYQPLPQPLHATAIPNRVVQTGLAEPAIPPAPSPSQAMPMPTPAQAGPGPSMLNQLLDESEPACGPGCSGTTIYQYQPYQTTGCESYGDCLECQPCEVCPWYITAAGLMMGRNDANKVWTTYETGVNANQLLNTEDAETDWRGGVEIRLGHRFCCGEWAVEGVFWTLDEMRGFAGLAGVAGGGQLSTPLNFEDVRYVSDPDPAAVDRPEYLFDVADAHYLRRINEFYNTEINLLRNATQGCGPLDVDVLFGVRWFRFREHLTFASLDQNGGDWSNGAAVGYLDDSIKNDLVGLQAGLDAGYNLGCSLRLFARPKIGIYNNHIEHSFNAYRGDGEGFTPATGSGVPGTYPVRSEDDVLSFLTEVDLGVEWSFHPQWSAFIGYRVLVATGIGLSDHQFTPYVVDIPELADIDHNGTLVLHGAFAGLSYQF
ncbi:MAG: BBP7 family outer membrane beta-barrel protein [Rhodopirellula sp.]|nr:BBP7 family outer membrane beta-barrel protein [Rhodopirellula sp.]